MLFDKESGVGARGTVRVPARGMTDRSVRKKQQPPSLKRRKIILRRWRSPVNSPWIGLESQVAGSGQPGRPPARGTEEEMEPDNLLCSRNTRPLNALESIRHSKGRVWLHFFEGFSTVAACWNVCARS